jgi:hypothetical protein
MSPQADYIVANGTGAAVRSDLNGQLAAIVSNNSGATEPATMYAYQWWADTTTGLLKLRNSANSAWVTIRQLDGEFSTVPVENGSAAAPSIYFKDSGTDSGFFSPGTDAVAISTAGTNRLHITSGGLVGIGNSGPSSKLDVTVPVNIPSTGSPDAGSFITARGNTASVGYGPSFSLSNSSGVKETFWRISAVTASGNNGDLVFNGYNGGADYPERLRITAGGLVAIGTIAPTQKLDVNGNIRVGSNQRVMFGPAGFEAGIKYATSGALQIAARAGESITFNGGEDGTERARLDSSGRLLVGTSTSPSSGNGQFAPLVVQGYIGGSTSLAYLSLQRGEAASSITADEGLGAITFGDNAGNTFAQVAVVADGTAGSGDYPGRLTFSTTADGGSSPTERMRITAGGDIHIGTGSTSVIYDQTSVFGVNIGKAGVIQIARNNDALLLINRIGGDGNLVLFSENGTLEGSISVSGTTVSYNGAHLSRWSQLPSGAERTEILRGSVLSNIDEMCEWGDEDNEQLNRMKVSTVEGDKNVSGAFQAWDDDDDTYTNDFYCAMTGDFIIRIADGVTVERGDLLMSAGDGTAKPQDDDIIRSKTIAKVTSTNVSCTYEDGSYCVPCVLMAC